MNKHDYLLGSRRLHYAMMALAVLLAAFVSWNGLERCVLAGSDEWEAIGPSFEFLRKVDEHGPIQAVGFEVLAAVPFVDAGRMGDVLEYNRGWALIWTLPYFFIVGLFDFPVGEFWYRLPGTFWVFPGIAATYFFIYQLTRRHVAALFAMAMQATMLGYIISSRYLGTDGIFPVWLAFSLGFWIKFLRDDRPRDRQLAYITAMLYAMTTPDSPIGLASIFTLVVFWLWQEERIDPLRKPLAAISELRRVFVAWPLLWLVGFFGFQVLVELKLYIWERERFLNHANYLGRFFSRGTGTLDFYPGRVVDWYIYPNISAALIFTAFISVMMVRRREWRAGLAFGWLWTIFWLLMTLFVSNSSSNFARILHPMLVLGAAGIIFIYDRWPLAGSALGALFVAANIWGIYSYPLFCSLPTDQNVAQAVGYLIYEHGDEWGGAEEVGFFFPTQSLHAYMPVESYTSIGFEAGEGFGDCDTTPLDETVDGLDVIIAMPDDYDPYQQLTKYLDYAISHDCERQRTDALNAYARENGYDLVGTIVSADGAVHANIWSTEPLDVGEVPIEEANRLHYENYSRLSWYNR